MAVVSPVCHLHYFVFVTPLLTALWPGPRSPWTTAAMAAFFVVHTLSLFPIGMPWTPAMPLREFGLTTATALAVWAVALRRLRNAQTAAGTISSATIVSRAA